MTKLITAVDLSQERAGGITNSLLLGTLRQRDMTLLLKYFESQFTAAQWLRIQLFRLVNDTNGLDAYLTTLPIETVQSQPPLDELMTAISYLKSRPIGLESSEIAACFEKQQAQKLQDEWGRFSAELSDLLTSLSELSSDNMTHSDTRYFVIRMHSYLHVFSQRADVAHLSLHQVYERLIEFNTWLLSYYSLGQQQIKVTAVLDAMARSMAKVNAIKAELDKHNSVIKLDLQRVDYWQLPLLEWCCDTLGSFTDHKDTEVSNELLLAPNQHVEQDETERDAVAVLGRVEQNNASHNFSQSKLYHGFTRLLEQVCCEVNSLTNGSSLSDVQQRLAQLLVLHDEISAHIRPESDEKLGPSDTRATTHDFCTGALAKLRHATTEIQKNMRRQKMKHAVHLSSLGLPQLLVKNRQAAKRIERSVVKNEALISADAGVVLLWPFFSQLFSKLSLLAVVEENEDVQFTSEQALAKAHSVLCYIAKVDPHLHATYTINALLGLPADIVIDEPTVLEDHECAVIEHMLNAAIARWTALQDMSVASFTALFLQREGEVCLTETGVKIEVEDKPQDILIMRMPWGLGLIQLPWLSSLLIDVKWHRGF
ncbi:hypothetical protein BGP78_01450 [Pseudoalteromonas sp. MSK9-3]|uniref:contractile injection system tape measure protein n=1 Tax=Pseudoalteromonas sp. MSK9-3 TaxID=1897633 RepID=UPI000E6BC7F0|nr:contractile injection system tape measure protein [Pseudoalteromonas sp. MSK9-3]RJE76941.1 hypothetical protein BGP78_01450 [Pseudoalteromonas sp. MSK9-3]